MLVPQGDGGTSIAVSCGEPADVDRIDDDTSWYPLVNELVSTWRDCFRCCHFIFCFCGDRDREVGGEDVLFL